MLIRWHAPCGVSISARLLSNLLVTRRDLPLFTDFVLAICFLCSLCLSTGMSYSKEGRSLSRLSAQQPGPVISCEFRPLGIDMQEGCVRHPLNARATPETDETCGTVILSVTDTLNGGDFWPPPPPKKVKGAKGNFKAQECGQLHSQSHLALC